VVCIITVDNGVTPVPTTGSESVGIDLGFKTYAVLSDGTQFKMPKFKKEKKNIKRQQKKLSRLHRLNKKNKIKSSKRYEKQRIKFQKANLDLKNKRSDFKHKWSCEITNRFDIITMEKLVIKSMTIKGSQTHGLYDFVNMIKYKSERKGKYFYQVDTYFPSSQLCHNCGNRQPMSLGQRVYKCQCCGNEIDRDLNAALVLNNYGVNHHNNTAGTAGIGPNGKNARGDIQGQSFDSLDETREIHTNGNRLVVSMNREKRSLITNETEAACSLDAR